MSVELVERGHLTVRDARRVLLDGYLHRPRDVVLIDDLRSPWTMDLAFPPRDGLSTFVNIRSPYDLVVHDIPDHANVVKAHLLLERTHA